MPTKDRSNDADGWIACDDGLHLIQMDKNLSHYGWVFRKVDGGLPYSVREATPHEMAHALARQHLRIGVAQIAGQAPAQQPHPDPIAWMVSTAFWWTKEEAEKDAAAMVLPVVGLGPMTAHQGEPVWFMTEGGVSALHAKAKAISDQQGLDTSSYSVPLYTHADPGEVERLVAANIEYARRHLENQVEVARLRAALKFYADREHYHFESDDWDSVSGEPLNILWRGEEPDFIEDGTVARGALERQS